MFDSTVLTEEHEIEGFDCGVESLNSWLKEHALRCQRYDTTRIYVWLEDGSPTVVAYYSMAPTSVANADLSKGQAGNYSFPIPGYLIGKLAVDRSLQGQGLGRELLVDAIGKAVGAAEAYAGRLIVVDADEAAVSFYRKYDFQPVRETPLRLVMKVATARKQLTRPQQP